MKHFICSIVLLLCGLSETKSQEIKIDYIGLGCYETNINVYGFYKLWSFLGENTYSCYIDNDSIIQNIILYLSDKEISDDTYAWPIAILHVSNGNKTDMYEIGLRRMKKVGEENVYKIPWELWVLLKDLIPFDPIYDYYTGIILQKGIINRKGYYNTD